jgi:MerR family transcriptional regulator/heat shock protein HspR
MHPQTLRTYDRLGLVIPSRTKGAGRRYSPKDVRKLRLIQSLSQEEGINLNGIKRIIELNDALDAASERITELTDLIQALTLDEHVARIFTAGMEGVTFGRARIRTSQRALSA